jgi:hypothetical protein
MEIGCVRCGERSLGSMGFFLVVEVGSIPAVGPLGLFGYERDIPTSIQDHRSIKPQTPHVPVLLVFRVCMRALV